MILADDFEYRLSLLSNITYNEASSRITGIYEWLLSDSDTKEIIRKLEEDSKAKNLLNEADRRHPPKASTPEEVAGIGFILMGLIKEGTDPWQLSHQFGIMPTYSTNSLQDNFDSVYERYIEPAFNYIEREVQSSNTDDTADLLMASQNPQALSYPLEIHQSLNRFLRDHPDVRRNAFIMMQFGSTKSHISIVDAIRNSLSEYGITAHRADDKEYHDDLFGNVLTYLHGCSFGIAVFERLEADDFNPNVSLEVGYMRASGKSVCLLKDKTLNTLQTDLVGKLYKTFDPQDPENSIPSEIEKWLHDKDIIRI